MRNGIYWNWTSLFSDYQSGEKIIGVLVDSDTIYNALQYIGNTQPYYDLKRDGNYGTIELYGKNEVIYCWRKRSEYYMTLMPALEGAFIQRICAE